MKYRLGVCKDCSANYKVPASFEADQDRGDGGEDQGRRQQHRQVRAVDPVREWVVALVVVEG